MQEEISHKRITYMEEIKIMSRSVTQKGGGGEDALFCCSLYVRPFVEETRSEQKDS